MLAITKDTNSPTQGITLEIKLQPFTICLSTSPYGILVRDDVFLDDVLAALDSFMNDFDIEVHDMYDPDEGDEGIVPMSNPNDNIILMNGVLCFSVTAICFGEDSAAFRSEQLGRLVHSLQPLAANDSVNVKSIICSWRDYATESTVFFGGSPKPVVFGFGCAGDCFAAGYTQTAGILYSRREDLMNRSNIAYVEGPRVHGSEDIFEYMVCSRFPIMNVNQIKDAVRLGSRVFWKNPGYEVLRHVAKDGSESFLITYGKDTPQENSIGLTWQDGVTLNGREEDFMLERDLPKASY